jgi:hypothetical protein
VHGHHGVETGEVHAVLVTAGDVPGQQDIAVVLGGWPEPHAVAADLAVADLEVIPFNKKLIWAPQLVPVRYRKITYSPPSSTVTTGTQDP